MPRQPLAPVLFKLPAARWGISLALVVVLGSASSIRSSWAQGAAVPAQLQASLLAKLMVYDRNFAARAGTTARVLLITRAGDARSQLAAGAMDAALSQLKDIGGVPHETKTVPYETAAALVARIRSEKAAIVYITPGLDDAVGELGASLAGVDVLSVSAVSLHVPRGIVLGFDLLSGKPKILLNLPQAKRQNVDFKANVLKLVKVYR